MTVRQRLYASLVVWVVMVVVTCVVFYQVGTAAFSLGSVVLLCLYVAFFFFGIHVLGRIRSSG